MSQEMVVEILIHFMVVSTIWFYSKMQNGGSIDVSLEKSLNTMMMTIYTTTTVTDINFTPGKCPA